MTTKRRRAGEKKIDTWKYEDTKNGVEHTIDVLMVTKKSQYGAGSVTFRAECATADVEIENSDVNELRKLVWAEIREKTAIEWRPYLYIRVSGGGSSYRLENDGIGEQSRCEAQLHVHVDVYHLAEHGGKKWRRQNYAGYGASEGWPKTGHIEREWAGSEPYTASLVPDTAENRAALAELFKAMQKLNERVKTLFGPEQIKATLARVGNGANLLGSGEG